jgi:hypothetical protein
MTSEHSESTYSERMKERFGEVQTQLRRQMIMTPKPLVFAGMLPLSLNPAHMLSAAKALPTPVQLLLALASVGVGWASASWWKQRRTTNAAAH